MATLTAAGTAMGRTTLMRISPRCSAPRPLLAVANALCPASSSRQHPTQPSSRRRHLSTSPPRRPHPRAGPPAAAATRCRRAYHSLEHPPPPGPFSPTEREILAAAYRHVPAHGFSPEALARGARDAGYLDISTNVLPDGVFSLIRWHLVTRREALAGWAAENFGGAADAHGTQQQLSVREKAEALTWARLQGNGAVIERWQEALAIMAQPTYVPESLKELAELADEIWYLAGDVAVDSSWYSKRASLSAIYVSAELFMTNDRSEGYQETRAFLRRRLEETSHLGSAVRAVGDWMGFTAKASVNLLRSKGFDI